MLLIETITGMLWFVGGQNQFDQKQLESTQSLT